MRSPNLGNDRGSRAFMEEPNRKHLYALPSLLYMIFLPLILILHSLDATTFIMKGSKGNSLIFVSLISDSKSWVELFYSPPLTMFPKPLPENEKIHTLIDKVDVMEKHSNT